MKLLRVFLSQAPPTTYLHVEQTITMPRPQDRYPIVTCFKPVTNHVTRNFATLGLSLLQPTFTCKQAKITYHTTMYKTVPRARLLLNSR